MRQLADEEATMTTFKNNLMTVAGFYKDTETGELNEMVEVDWDPTLEKVQSKEFQDALSALRERLQSSGASLESIWSGNDPDSPFEDPDTPREYLLELIAARQSWTLVEIVGLQGLIPHSRTGRRGIRHHNDAVYNLIEQLQTEGQARTTLQDSHVFFVHQVDMRNGRIYNDSRILREQLPPDMEGIESRTVHIPGPYEDPITEPFYPR